MKNSRTDNYGFGAVPPGSTTGVPRFGTESFTLVEVAVAVLVVAIGVLAVFALISSGLTANAKAMSETHAAVFADNVFGEIHALSLQWAEEQAASNHVLEKAGQPTDDDTWDYKWNEFIIKNPLYDLTVTASNAWFNGATMKIKANQPPPFDVQALVFTNKPYHSPSVQNIVNHALRYRLVVEMSKPYPAVCWTNRALVTLYVYEGQFGKTNDPLIFYAEYDTAGDL